MGNKNELIEISISRGVLEYLILNSFPKYHLLKDDEDLKELGDYKKSSDGGNTGDGYNFIWNFSRLQDLELVKLKEIYEKIQDYHYNYRVIVERVDSSNNMVSIRDFYGNGLEGNTHDFYNGVSSIYKDFIEFNNTVEFKRALVDYWLKQNKKMKFKFIKENYNYEL
ncbi:hypothetical protein BPT24_261 [Tenacibaculum phage pT24]|uniref:Uncharacterized protein n=1 Tax=Tenacibaculum phage pT24 TaxID=1880590 RepID=A0A1B4XX46_9CAUD|nr:hypothetical protein HYP10_gp267 [Tenacibaculum phage pT24]BAV39379.1 hypothetical protein BPT24_261 [Tenacibaculum phage pT24]